ncbi:MAG: S8 family serine peptidase [Betaproteobacteria bacterium]
MNTSHRISNLKLTQIAFSISLAFTTTPTLAADVYAPWLTQIGLTTSVLSAANWGKGVLLGVVDTGIIANSPFFSSGQVSSSLSSCAAVSFKCSNGFVDDNGHGTAVAAIAAGNNLFPWASTYGGYKVSANSIVSVAPSANIVSEKVLSAAGSGYSTDVANGIIKAANAGAAVINVSITYGNSADTIAAINYAASKGSFIVWAGGNSAVNLLSGANTSGLTAAAINHLVFAGSVNAANVLSSFSNKPGSGSLVGVGINAAYSSRWIMAPGESILAPYSPSQPSTWGYWSGTSMSAPVVSGSLVLMEAAWPILKTNGTAANLLLATATDLGVKGVDTTYGNGLVNLTTAFRPYGTLSVTAANGKQLAVPSITGAMLSSGALGSLATVQSKLANYTAFDGYARNFSINLSNMIKSPSTTALLNPLPTNVKTAPLAIKLADGSVISTWLSEPLTAIDHLGEFNYNPANTLENRSMYFAIDYKDGTTLAFGNGYPAQYSYGQAFFGDRDMAMLSSQLSTDGLSSLADGGAMVSYGTNLSPEARIALSWNGSPEQLRSDPNSTIRDSSNIKVGLSYKFNNQLTSGITVGTLTETNGLLGSSYNPGSAISFNGNNRSYSIGFTAGYAFNENNSMLMETGYSVTQAAQGSGLIAGTTDIQSQSFGASFMSKNLMSANDRLVVSYKQPLRVTSGQAGVLMPSVDHFGYAVFTTEWASLVPDGHEADYKISYDMPAGVNKTLGLQAGYRQDVMNISGSNDASVGASWKMSF